MSEQHDSNEIRRWLGVLALALSLALFVGACGDGDDTDAFTEDASEDENPGDENSGDEVADSDDDGSADADASDPDDSADDATDDDATNDDATDSDSSDDSDMGDTGDTGDTGDDGDDLEIDGANVDFPDGGEGFCGDFYSFLESVTAFMPLFFEGEPDEVEAAAVALGDSMDAIEESVPSDLADELQLANQQFTTMLELLEAHDYGTEAANADPAASPEKTQEMIDAEETMFEYSVSECDYDPESVGLTPPS